MKNRTMAFALSVLVAGCFAAGELSAWERSAMEDCKKDMQGCKNDVSECRKDSSKTSKDCKKMMADCKQDHRTCKKNAESKDNASFEKSLSKYNRSKFKDLTPDQKKKALDFADKNKMTPDDAFEKVTKK